MEFVRDRECVGGAGDGFEECWRFGKKGIC